MRNTAVKVLYYIGDTAYKLCEMNRVFCFLFYRLYQYCMRKGSELDGEK